ncbi:MAG TPA: SurA N-terminal domain-containing protein [Blastocatellia bacterium]|jgi:parvulin-like peptidyl-prolyl isomerase
MKFAAKALTAILMISSFVPAQEPQLVNEIVARVNNEIITLADYNAALEELKADVARQLQQQGKSAAQIEEEYNKLKPTVLDLMIDNMLLEQRAKELGIDVEAELNQEWAAIAKRNGFPNVLEFEKALRQQGTDPDAARAGIRKEIQHQYVMQQEIYAPIFRSIRDEERRAYYEKNKEIFMTPGEVTISEIFLPLENYTAADVEQRARRIVAEIRAGLDFKEAVQKYSAPSRGSKAQEGKVGVFKIGLKEGRELREEDEAAISGIKVGEITEPIRLQDGFKIIRLDDRKLPQALPYEDNRVQNFIGRRLVEERGEEARRKYLKRLREEAFIKIARGYQAAQN